MRIAAVHLDGFGRLRNLDLEFADGLNIVTGANEAGKSTLHLFIRSVLYGADTAKRVGRKSIYERMKPWDTPHIYGGSIDVYHGGGKYRISRDFARAADDLSISPLHDGGTVSDSAAFMKELLHGLSESAYANTVSVGQLSSETDRSIASEIVRYASNMTETQNPVLNADKALSYLAKKKDLLKRNLKPEAVKEYNQLLSRKNALEKSLSDPLRNNLIRQMRDAGSKAGALAGETAVEIADNELIIGEREERLKSHGLSDLKDVERLKSDADGIYTYYAKKKKALPVYLVLGILGAVCGVCGLLELKRDIFGIYQSAGSYMDYIAVGSLMLLVFGVLMLAAAAVTGVRKNNAEDSLYELIDPHIDDVIDVSADESRDSSIDDDMRLFYGCIEEYSREARTAGAARDERQRLMAKLKGYNADRSRYLEELKKQQDIKSLVEADLTELGDVTKRLRILERQIDENSRLRDEIEAVDMAEDVLSQLAESIRNSAGTYINSEAGRMLEGVTGGAYDSLDAGTGGNIRVNTLKGFLSPEDISRGTVDQIYLAVRIAAARYLAGGEDPIPLVLDDSFALYDDSRLLKALSFLAAGYRGQIIIFTCQNREASVLSCAGIGYNLLRI